MCRILACRISERVDAENLLRYFAEQCQLSQEYQGDGWGITYFKDYRWHSHWEIDPIWEADFSPYQGSHVLFVHARSASFGGPNLEENMPFETSRFSFVFNGEIRGVRLNAPGRIGAEKLFRFILNFYRGDITEAIERAMSIVPKRVEKIRAMNFVILDKSIGNFYVYSRFTESPNYFTVLTGRTEEGVFVSSVPVIPSMNPLGRGKLEVL